MLEDNKMYNCIVREFQLNTSILDGVKSEIKDLTKARIDICKLLKLSKFSYENLDIYESEFIINIDINKLKINDYEKNQIEFKDKIKMCKQDIKEIKLLINRLEYKIIQERRESKKNNEALRIFLRREKFKFIKKIIFRSYRKVFFRYSNVLNITTKIVECNKRKEDLRIEKQNLHNSLGKYNRKIIMDKIAIAQMRKSIIRMEKETEFLLTKIQSIMDYKEMEKKFRQIIKIKTS